jgi:hypothetical protein
MFKVLLSCEKMSCLGHFFNFLSTFLAWESVKSKLKITPIFPSPLENTACVRTIFQRTILVCNYQTINIEYRYIFPELSIFLSNSDIPTIAQPYDVLEVYRGRQTNPICKSWQQIHPRARDLQNMSATAFC